MRFCIALKMDNTDEGLSFLNTNYHELTRIVHELLLTQEIGEEI